MSGHRQYYHVLGLDAPPEDRKSVKRAYSKQLKVTRPEDDPDGFMELRQAHDHALQVLKWKADREAKQPAYEEAKLAPLETPAPTESTQGPIVVEPEASTSAPEPAEPIAEPSPEPGLTYGDMLPSPHLDLRPEPASETSYSIGPTPNLDAPVTRPEAPAPRPEPLMNDLNNILSDNRYYNDRGQWNLLFRKARQLDIDDYVDFEQLLMNSILRFHGYFEDHPHYDTPEKMPQKFSPSITASLFKTMSWDQISKLGHTRGRQVEWLSRRMRLRRYDANSIIGPTGETKSSNNTSIWLILLGVFLVARVLLALANG